MDNTFNKVSLQTRKNVYKKYNVEWGNTCWLLHIALYDCKTWTISAKHKASTSLKYFFILQDEMVGTISILNYTNQYVLYSARVVENV